MNTPTTTPAPSRHSVPERATPQQIEALLHRVCQPESRRPRTKQPFSIDPLNAAVWGLIAVGYSLASYALVGVLRGIYHYLNQ